MKYVLDSSVAFKWGVNEVDSAKALRLRDETRAGLHELHAPDVFLVEVAHAITRAERQGRLTPAVGKTFFLSVLAELPTLHPLLPLMPRAYELSSAMRLGVYDFLYVALAEREGVRPRDGRRPTGDQPRGPVPVRGAAGGAAVTTRTVPVMGNRGSLR
jgi:predicted nucleic acid-binding protein